MGLRQAKLGVSGARWQAGRAEWICAPESEPTVCTLENFWQSGDDALYFCVSSLVSYRSTCWSFTVKTLKWVRPTRTPETEPVSNWVKSQQAQGRPCLFSHFSITWCNSVCQWDITPNGSEWEAWIVFHVFFLRYVAHFVCFDHMTHVLFIHPSIIFTAA